MLLMEIVKDWRSVELDVTQCNGSGSSAKRDIRRKKVGGWWPVRHHRESDRAARKFNIPSAADRQPLPRRIPVGREEVRGFRDVSNARSSPWYCCRLFVSDYQVRKRSMIRPPRDGIHAWFIRFPRVGGMYFRVVQGATKPRLHQRHRTACLDQAGFTSK